MSTESNEQLLSRSHGVWRDATRTEIYTPTDYAEARLFESIFEETALNEGLHDTVQTFEQSALIGEVATKLGITADNQLACSVLNAHGEMRRFCFEVAQFGFSTMSDIEKASYHPDFSPEAQPELKPFYRQLMYLLSRYITERVDRELAFEPNTSRSVHFSQSIDASVETLASVQNHIRSLFEYDIPVYDRLFETFDTIAQVEPESTEAYLGRDGIHAYYGRLGAIAARESANNSSDDAIRLLYFVYSSNIKQAPARAKKDYIAQHVRPSEVVQYFDTGYSGSIPEDIMQTLGHDRALIESRIHLLNSSNGNPARRVRTLEADHYVGDIEAMPKPEGTALGLIAGIDGKEHYVRDCSSLEEQLKFGVLRSMTIRHYWLREYSHQK
ncbi:MAG TPA: hypothetical protein PKD15_03765, partial [Candidatus Saccharibacteria bacterium]|nr:hypothetical protein [Candidatus Saccharibacteria bacterium]